MIQRLRQIALAIAGSRRVPPSTSLVVAHVVVHGIAHPILDCRFPSTRTPRADRNLLRETAVLDFPVQRRPAEAGAFEDRLDP